MYLVIHLQFILTTQVDRVKFRTDYRRSHKQLVEINIKLIVPFLIFILTFVSKSGLISVNFVSSEPLIV